MTRCFETAWRPQFSANRGKCVTERGQWFRIPARGSRRECVSGIEIVGPQCDQREQAKKSGRGARDGGVRPLPLGLDAKMTTDFGEGDLDGPTADEPAKDVDWVGIEIGA